MLLDLSMVGHLVTAEVTLSRRDEMGFRMLVGREALRQGFLVDPGRSYLGGRPKRSVRRLQPGRVDGARVVRDRQRPDPGRDRPRAGAADHPAGDRRRREPAGAGRSTAARTGPTVWVDAAIHGDEVVGVEVIRQVMAGLDPKDVPRHADRGADRQRARLHDRRPLPARPARPQPLLPRLGARLAGQPDRPPVHERGGRQVRGRHRPAHRLRPPLQPAAGPGRPRRRPHPRAGRGVRGAGDAARPDPRRLAAPRRPRARRHGAALRGRREPPLRRLRDRRRRRRRTPGARLARHDRRRRPTTTTSRASSAAPAAGSARGVPASSTSTSSSGSG